MNFRVLWERIRNNKKPYLLYGTILLAFIIWMLFLDTNSWSIHSELNQEIDRLEKERKVLNEIIKKDQKTIEILQDQDSLERFARENYGHKKNNETVFIIESQDSSN
jgi:cell division protein FtsB